MNRVPQARCRHHAGASAVEFALVLPVLILLAFGIFGFSQAYNRSQGMQAGVREGARFGALGSGGDPPTPITAQDVEDRTLAAIQNNDAGSGFEPGDLEVEVRVYTDSEDPTDKTDGAAIAGTAAVCASGIESIRVDVHVKASAKEKYEISIPLVPGSPFDVFDAGSSRFAIFRCLP